MRKILTLISLALLISSANAGPLSAHPQWRSCLESGQSVASCSRRVLNISTERGSSGAARSFTPSSSGLTAAEEARVTQMINSNSVVQSNSWYGRDARSRAINAQSTASSALWYGQDARSRAISARSRADQAYSYTWYGSGVSQFDGTVCPNGYYRRTVNRNSYDSGGGISIGYASVCQRH